MVSHALKTTGSASENSMSFWPNSINWQNNIKFVHVCFVLKPVIIGRQKAVGYMIWTQNVLRSYHERPVQSNALFPQSSFAQKERVHMVERDQYFDKKIKKVIWTNEKNGIIILKKTKRYICLRYVWSM